MLTATNPATGRVIHQQPALTAGQIEQALTQAHVAFTQWQRSTFDERAAVLVRLAAQLRHQQTELARLMALEMGKPISQGLKEVEKAASCCEYYADNAATFLQIETLPSDASHSFVCYQPLGPILGILPWNMPVWLAFRYCAPALMAGNTCIMKHDPNTPQTAQAIASLFNAASAPTGLLVNVPIETEDVAKLIADSRIAAVSFTGSSAAGRKVAAAAGAALKHCVLELGGSDPCVIFADADLALAADVAVQSRFNNSGQSCIAAKRILVEDSIYSDFIKMLENRIAKLTVGNPLEHDTHIGPLARNDLRQTLHAQIEASINAGATCVLGGQLPTSDGYFYPPTLLTQVTPDMAVFKEETFGPVMCVSRFKGADQALALANNTDYGLGSSIWTSNETLANRFAQQLCAGQVAVNGLVKTDPRLPSGGIKQSGMGRELGPHGIREFVNTKQVWIK